MVNSSHQLMKEEKGSCIAAVDAFNVAEKRILQLKNKLTEAERDKKSVETALEGVERQAEGERRQLCQTEDQLTTSNEQITALKKKLEEAKKAKDQTEQDGYDVGVAEIEEALRVKVSEVCGTRPLIKLRLRPLLHLGEQRVYTTLLPSVHQALPAPRLTLPQRWQRLARTARPRPFSLLTAIPRQPSSPRLLKKKQT